MNNSPKITIAIPTYNRASYLAQAIESALTQTYWNTEIIVSDNASTDNTKDIVKNFNDSRICYFRQEENVGQVSNWNYCLEQARGEFFLMLSDDDILERYAIENLKTYFNDPLVTLAYSRVLYIDQNSLPTTMSLEAPAVEFGHEFIINALKGLREVMPSATLHRTEIARQLGGYPHIGTATDLVVRLSIAKDGLVVCDPNPLVRYRKHEQSLSLAIKQVVLSHEKFIEWASEKNTPLFNYNTNIQDYCIGFINNIARSAALKGDKEALFIARESLKRLDPCWIRQALICFYSTFFVRWIAKVIKRVIRR